MDDTSAEAKQIDANAMLTAPQTVLVVNDRGVGFLQIPSMTGDTFTLLLAYSTNSGQGGGITVQYNDQDQSYPPGAYMFPNVVGGLGITFNAMPDEDTKLVWTYA